MRVIVVTQYFPPETGGPQNRLASMVTGLSDAGHEVVVVTQKPNYPAGIVWDEYRGRVFREGSFEGCRVIHTAIWEDRSKKFLSRLAYFLTFVALSVPASFRIRGPVDVVVASSPPLFVGLAGWAIAKLKRAKFVFDVRDLWPEVAVAMGELKGKRAIRVATALEHFIYKRADAITAVTDSFCKDIRATVPGADVSRVTNGTVSEQFAVNDDPVDLRRELDLPNDFLVAYIGNLGLAQGLDHIVDAARIVAERDAGVRFLIVGDGSAGERLRSRADAAGLHNLDIRPRVDLATASRYMAASDVLLVPLGNHPIYRKFIPSKLFDSMAAARPVLLSVDGESRAILEAAGAGWYYPAEDADALADAILKARIHADELKTIGLRGRRFVEENFTRSAEAAKLVAVAERVAAAGSASAGDSGKNAAAAAQARAQKEPERIAS